LRRTLLATLLLICAVLGIAIVRLRGAPVVAREGDARQFSAERARDVIATFASVPHATGTPALANARARIVEKLRAIGLSPLEKSTLTCGRYGVCARVNQIAARIAGTASTGTVLLIAHLDAVGAAPGASDDGAGSGSLVEIARALGAPQRNDVLFLWVEGEELGLIGAEAFVRDDPAARDVRVVINLEARGTRGGASLFQISRDSRYVVEAAASLPHPLGSSLFASIYERMPNDTDLSVFLAHGYGAMNFAFTGGVENYHTANDDLAHQDPRSVQQLGESGLAAARALAAIDLKAPRRGEVAFFDVLSILVVRYPQSWAFALSLIALAGLALVAVRRATLGSVSLGIAAWLLTIVMAAILGALVYFAANLAHAFPAPWIARPEPLLLALIAAALLSVVTAAAVARRLLDPTSFAIAIAICQAVVGALVARAMAGGSYLFVVPALVAAIALWERRVGIPVFALTQVILWCVVVDNLYPVLGAMAAPGLALIVAVMLAPIAPLLLDLKPRRIQALLGVVMVLALIGAIVVRPFSRQIPQRVNVAAVREDGAAGRVGVDATWGGRPWGSPPAAMVAALIRPRSEPLVPWRDDQTMVGDLPLDVAAPEVTLVEKSERRVRLKIRTLRDASSLYVIASPTSGLFHIDVVNAVGQASFLRRGIVEGRGIRIDGEREVEVILSYGGTLDLMIADATYGAPAAAAVIAARPAEAVPTQDGDVTIAYRRMRP
jgi:hypothetical protein